MGIFGQSSPFEAEIEKATNEKNTTEPWNFIMDICDKVSSNPRNAKDCLKAIQKRLAHSDPHVVIQALTLLDACVNNCGKNFHLEVASREFVNEYRKLLMKAQAPLASKMRLLIKKWSENDFQSDPQLSLIPSFYQQLKTEGLDFSESPQTKQSAKAAAAQAAALKDPNVVSSQQEEEDIAKAIELSLKENKASPKKKAASGQTASGYTQSSTTQSTLYPTFSTTDLPNSLDSFSGAESLPTAVEPRKVRAIYDFEAVEENELTFIAGEIIHVLDDSDPNWWKGYNQRGEGLFPSNFVTADLNVEPEQLNPLKNKKSVKFEDDMNGGVSNDSKKDDTILGQLSSLKIEPEINEQKVDRLLHLLHEANPEDPSEDPDEMLQVEDEVNQMSPLIDAELERVDRKHAHLTQLSSDLVDAINLYHTLMREPDRSGMGGMLPPGGASYIPNANSMYNQPPNMYAQQQMFGMPPGQTNISNFYQPGMPNQMVSGIARNGMQSLPGQMAMMQHQHNMSIAPSPTPPPAPQQQQIANQGSPQMQSQTIPPSTLQFPQQQQMMGGNNGTYSPQLHQQAGQHQIVAPQPQMIPMQYQNGHPPGVQQQQLIQQKQQQMSQQTIPNSQNHQNFISSMQPPNSIPNQQQNFPPQGSAPHPSQQILGGSFPAAQSIVPGASGLPQQGQFPLPQQQQTNPQQMNLPHNNLPSGSLGAGSINSNIMPGMGGGMPLQQQQQMQQMMLHQPQLNHGLPHPHPQQFAAINQPVTQTILGQNDPKTNVPIYQQQR